MEYGGRINISQLYQANPQTWGQDTSPTPTRGDAEEIKTNPSLALQVPFCVWASSHRQVPVLYD